MIISLTCVSLVEVSIHPPIFKWTGNYSFILMKNELDVCAGMKEVVKKDHNQIQIKQQV